MCACKTPKSHRIIPIPEDLYQELCEFKRQLVKYKSYRDTWFVFGDKNPIGTHKMNNWKNAYCKKAGIKQIRLHDFRHSCASILINNGASIMVVAKYLGHTKIDETLNTYSHLFKNKLDEITKTMDLLE